MPAPDRKEALDTFRAKLRGSPLVASVISTSWGTNPHGGSGPEGIVVLYAAAAPAAAGALQALAQEAAPGVPLYAVPSDPPRPI